MLLFVLLLAGACWPGVAHSQIRRCAGPDGTSIFTDRRCQDIGSVERLPREPASGAAGASRIYSRGCARNLQDLVYELTTAIDSKDANRLASVYHWPGMSGSTGYQVLARLDGIVRRPLVDIVPVMPASPDGVDGDLYPQTSVRRAPVALRVEQTLANGSTPSRTVFGLQRHFGCWWVRL
ncbi:hypothetical protein ACFQZQ_08170 [Lysobacter koreensis]|uniref:DUF4124 domain-containing protein n=1 Tax=Lysobacter koreensis TaxID=266122 RepID=A0ABW2YRL4_9GAMM